MKRVGPLRAVPRSEASESGASLVEFSLVLPVFMMLLLGIFTGGLAYSRKLSVGQAAREGARYAATLPITATAPLPTWLDRVSALTIASSEGELAGNKPGSVVCVAYVSAGGSATRLRTIGGVSPGPEALPCIDDDGRSGETRVQVVAERTSNLEALVFSRELTLASHAVARYESP